MLNLDRATFSQPGSDQPGQSISPTFHGSYLRLAPLMPGQRSCLEPRFNVLGMAAPFSVGTGFGATSGAPGNPDSGAGRVRRVRVFEPSASAGLSGAQGLLSPPGVCCPECLRVPVPAATSPTEINNPTSARPNKVRRGNARRRLPAREENVAGVLAMHNNERHDDGQHEQAVQELDIDGVPSSSQQRPQPVPLPKTLADGDQDDILRMLRGLGPELKQLPNPQQQQQQQQIQQLQQIQHQNLSRMERLTTGAGSDAALGVHDAGVASSAAGAGARPPFPSSTNPEDSAVDGRRMTNTPAAAAADAGAARARGAFLPRGPDSDCPKPTPVGGGTAPPETHQPVVAVDVSTLRVEMLPPISPQQVEDCKVRYLEMRRRIMPFFQKLADRALGDCDPVSKVPLNPEGPRQLETCKRVIRQYVNDQLNTAGFLLQIQHLLQQDIPVTIHHKLEILMSVVRDAKRRYEDAKLRANPVPVPVVVPELIIPATVQTVEPCAFMGQTAITKLIIPSTVVHIGPGAFSFCSGIAGTLVIPPGVITIGHGAFSCCSKITEVVLPPGLAEIADRVFAGCAALRRIVIPDTVKKIGQRAFRGCIELATINIPGSVTTIGREAFCNCTAMSRIILPDTVKKLGYGAFAGCISLAEVTLPPSLTKIGYHTFRGCVSLKELGIPNTVTWLGRGAFLGCRNLRELRIPEGVTKIGVQAFRNCSRITEIHVPAACSELGGNAFRGCDQLAYVITPRVGAGSAESFAGYTELPFAATTRAGPTPETNRSAVVSTPLAVIKHGDIFAECPKLQHLRLETSASRLKIMRLRFWNPSTHLQRCTSSQRQVIRGVLMISARLGFIPGEIWAMILQNLRPRDLGPLGLN